MIKRRISEYSTFVLLIFGILLIFYEALCPGNFCICYLVLFIWHGWIGFYLQYKGEFKAFQFLSVYIRADDADAI